MKKPTTLVTICLYLLLLSPISFAGTGSVIQVKGKKAIVQFDNPPKVGDSVTSSSEGLSNFSSQANSGGFKWSNSPRKYTLAWSAPTLLASTSGSGTTATTLGPISAQVSYIWGKYEIGPILGFSSSGSTSTFGLGVLGAYDFVENKPGVELIPSIYAKFISTSDSGNSTGSSTTLGFGAEADEYLADRIAVLANIEYDATSYSSGSVSGFYIGTGFKLTF